MGEPVGCDPRSLGRQTLQSGRVDLGRDKSPSRAIWRTGLDHGCRHKAEIRESTATGFPLWPFRMGVNVLYGKAGVAGGETSTRELGLADSSCPLPGVERTRRESPRNVSN